MQDSPRQVFDAQECRLDQDCGVALFHQITVILRDRILSGQLAPGYRLPSEAEICAAFGVSRITAKRSLDELAAIGLVDRARGRGTTVRQRPETPVMRAAVEGWIENISRMGESTRARVLEFGYFPAPPHVAEALDLSSGTEVQRSIRVRSIEGECLSHLETWVPAEIGRSYERAEMEDVALLRLLERHGVKVTSARQTITAAVAPPNIATALGIHAGAPLLDVRRIVMDRAGRPVEYIRVLYRPDLYRYEMDLTRVQGSAGGRWKARSLPANPDGRAPSRPDSMN